MPCSQNTAISRESTAESIVQRCNLYRVFFINSPEPHHSEGEGHSNLSEWVFNRARRFLYAAQEASVEHHGDSADRLLCQGRRQEGQQPRAHTHLSSARLATCSPSWLKHTERTQRSLAPPAKIGVGGGNRCLWTDRQTDRLRDRTRPQPGQQSSGTPKQAGLDQFTADSAVGTELPCAPQRHSNLKMPVL